ncbi:hypothetical protein OIU79_018111 [Salix purpurea]|uniref:Uncharacterized protein n=1 Tax=Salix purpurea TaxID=77065 RepID=A0A9Q0WXY1_SALPP|nr:hypothetical protein OIU79_018111 [Salix purpurea]
MNQRRSLSSLWNIDYNITNAELIVWCRFLRRFKRRKTQLTHNLFLRN